jgi:hypothetical protein
MCFADCTSGGIRVEEIGCKVSMEAGELSICFEDGLGDRRDHSLTLQRVANLCEEG